MGNRNSGARGRSHPNWSGGIRYLTCVDDLLLVNESDRGAMKKWLSSKCTTNTETECIEWIGRLDRHGYGMVGLKGKTAIAHRFVWVLSKMTALGTQHLLHRCDNPKCVNIDHLFVGTHTDNMRDAASKGRFLRSGELNGRYKHGRYCK